MFNFQIFSFSKFFENPVKILRDDPPTLPKASRTIPKNFDFFDFFVFFQDADDEEVTLTITKQEPCTREPQGSIAGCNWPQWDGLDRLIMAAEMHIVFYQTAVLQTNSPFC